MSLLAKLDPDALEGALEEEVDGSVTGTVEVGTIEDREEFIGKLIGPGGKGFRIVEVFIKVDNPLGKTAGPGAKLTCLVIDSAVLAFWA